MNKVISAGATLFALSLIQQGCVAVQNPPAFAKTFGVSIQTPNETNYVRAAGVRELFFGLAIAILLVADTFMMIRDGSRAASLTIASAACVGFGDALLTRSLDPKVAIGHAQGGSVLAIIAAGLWLTAP